MNLMKMILVAGAVFAVVAMASPALAQKDKETEPTSVVNFLVIKDDNGKPVRNAAVIMHAVDAKGKQERGDMELKTDPEGKTNFDGIPYGMLRVQVLAQGFQTYGEDFDVEKPRMDFTIKLKRPKGQFSIYEDRTKDPNAPKSDAPPPDPKDKKPN